MTNIISWNVNGLRSVIKKDALNTLLKTVSNIDILCLQEIKISKEQISDFQNILPNYNNYFNTADKKGYSGTAIFTKHIPICVYNGFQNQEIKGVEEDEADGENTQIFKEGRLLTLEFKDYFLVNVYTPNSRGDLSRLGFRQKWDNLFKDFVSQLLSQKPVIICGDFNVAHQPIDVARKQNDKTHGFTPQERQGFTDLLNLGFIDIFRLKNKVKDENKTDAENGNYTWWSNFGNCRQKNIGWRIDYFLISDKLVDNRQNKNPNINKQILVSIERKFSFTTQIYKDILGSDHSPIGLRIGL